MDDLGCALNPMDKCPYNRQEKTQTHRGDGRVKMEPETGLHGYEPRNTKRGQQPPEAGRESHSEPPERTNLNFRLLTSRTARE